MGKEYTRTHNIAGNISRGQGIILADDFESSDGWTKGGAPSGWTSAIRTDYFLSKTSSYYLMSDDGSPADGDYVSMSRLVSGMPTKRLAISFWLLSPDISRLKYLDVAFGLDDGSDLYIPACRYDGQTPKFRLGDGVGSYQDVPNSDITLASLCWHFFRLVCNMETELYETLQIGTWLADISDVTVPKTTSLGEVKGEFQITAHTNEANEIECYVDNVLITTQDF